jgi:hypothetical protein
MSMKEGWYPAVMVRKSKREKAVVEKRVEILYMSAL